MILLFVATEFWFLNTLIPTTNYLLEIVLYCTLLFSAAMVCHGELYAARPSAAHLARFYLMVSIGGALGGFFVSYLAPLIFRDYWELYLGIAAIWILLAVISRRKTNQAAKINLLPFISSFTALLVCIHFGLLVYYTLTESRYTDRNFFGVVQVRYVDTGSARENANVLVDGSTLHGMQFTDPVVRELPTAYYSYDSGIDLAIRNHPRYGSGLRIGVLGLGAGTLAAYGQPGVFYRFYEINPVIVDLANGKGGYFSFLEGQPGRYRDHPRGCAHLPRSRNPGRKDERFRYPGPGCLQQRFGPRPPGDQGSLRNLPAEPRPGWRDRGSYHQRQARPETCLLAACAILPKWDSP